MNGRPSEAALDQRSIIAIRIFCRDIGGRLESISLAHRGPEVRYLPQSLISDVPRIVAGLRVGQSFSTIPVPNPPIIRKGASGTFYDKGLEGGSHHAVIPNVNTIGRHGRACRPMRKNCSTSSRGPIWPP